MFLRIVEILLPIFAIVAVGFVYGRKHRPEMAVANRINLDVFLPALVFATLAGKSYALKEDGLLALAALLALLLPGLLAWPVARFIGVSPRTFVPPMMFNNSGNIGLPVAFLAWGEGAMPVAVVFFLAANLLHFSLGIRMLDPQAKLLGLWRIPVLAAALAGLAVGLLKLSVWPPVMMAIKLLGDISIPLLLFALGVRMTNISLSDWKLSFFAAAFRPLAGMICAWCVIVLLGLTGRDAAMLLVFGGLPPAVLNFMFAERYHQEPARVASMVLLGNLVALVVLPVALVLSAAYFPFG
ncbi:MAG: Membrane transport protein [Betaproteobacteria bacterium ADurb.Bin341]|nr:MAG: Membrane transport protein [Betaproteobacteria bacterium ADurb.Bin341]